MTKPATPHDAPRHTHATPRAQDTRRQATPQHAAERYALAAAGTVIIALTAAWLLALLRPPCPGRRTAWTGKLPGPAMGLARDPGRLHRRGRTADAPRRPSPGDRLVGGRSDRHRIGRIHCAQRGRGERHGQRERRTPTRLRGRGGSPDRSPAGLRSADAADPPTGRPGFRPARHRFRRDAGIACPAARAHRATANHRTGVNVNQIARALNSDLTPPDIRQRPDELRHLLTLIAEALRQPTHPREESSE